MSDTKALEEYLRLSLHSYEWGEMSLLQQAELRDQAAAELAQLNRDKDEARGAAILAVTVLCETRKHTGRRPCLFCQSLLPREWRPETLSAHPEETK